jgi:hypothetical protein
MKATPVTRSSHVLRRELDDARAPMRSVSVPVTTAVALFQNVGMTRKSGREAKKMRSGHAGSREKPPPAGSCQFGYSVLLIFD